MNDRLTLDYGVRFVNQQPQYDQLLPGVELPAGQVEPRPRRRTLYVAGCANGVYPCSGTNRQAMNPLTGQFLGPNTAAGDRHAGAELGQPD